MKYLKYIKELNSDTLDSAAEKAKELGQHSLADKFINHKDFQTTLSNLVGEELFKSAIFDFNLHYYLNHGHDEMYPDNPRTKIKLKYGDWFDENQVDGECYHINVNILNPKKLFNDKKNITNNHIFHRIAIYPEGWIEMGHPQNKFTSKKEAVKFINFLSELYLKENNDMKNNIFGKLHDTKLSKVDNGDFCAFIKHHYGDFNTFKKEIKLRSLYDNY